MNPIARKKPPDFVKGMSAVHTVHVFKNVLV